MHEEEISRQVNELIENKIIKPSQSPYNTSVYYLPNIIDILDQLGSAQYFSLFDLASEFY